MKNRMVALLLCVLLLGVTACGQQETANPKHDTTAPSTNPTENTETPEKLVIPDDLQSCLTQAGLIEPLLFSISDTATFAEGVTGKAYLFLADDTNVEEEFNSFAYLAILYNKTVLLKSLDTYALGGSVSAGDLDGDGDSEVLVHLAVGATGGAGNYDTRVFDLQEEQLTEMFDFYRFDTGYAIELLADKKYRITNRFTDYSAEFLREGENESYFDFWYNKDGTIQEQDILVDSFFECRLTDTDQNGVCELSIMQYTSLIGHLDGIGHAVSVLTYNKESKTFEVTQASFKPL